MSHALIKKLWHISILLSLCMTTITFESFLLGWIVLPCHNGRRYFYSVFQPSKWQWFTFRETVMRKNGPCIVSTEVSLMSLWDPCCTVYLFFLPLCNALWGLYIPFFLLWWQIKSWHGDVTLGFSCLKLNLDENIERTGYIGEGITVQSPLHSRCLGFVSLVKADCSRCHILQAICILHNVSIFPE